MNRYPNNRSVLVLDNCAIHKSAILRQVVEDHGCLLVFLPPYSPDFNPIEESFSACKNSPTLVYILTPTVKAWIRRNWRFMRDSENPEVALYEAMGTITAEKAREWVRHSGYNM